MPAPLSSKQKLAFEWFAMSDAERFRAGLPIDSKGLRKYLHISDTTGKKWEREYFDKKNREIMEHSLYGQENEALKVPIEESYDSQEWLDGKTDKADKALLRACEQGNAQALKIYYQLTQRLIEKQEVTHDFSAADYNRITGQVITELRRSLKECSGICPVCQQQPLLPQKIRQDKG